jgi:hypothetical protein
MARTGYILRTTLDQDGPTRYFVQALVGHPLVLDENPDRAWFTESLNDASVVLIDLFARQHGEFRIVPHTHNR